MSIAPLLALAVAVSPAPGEEVLRAGPGSGQVVIHVYKKGLFAVFAHDHAFEPALFGVTAWMPAGDPAHTRVEVVLDTRTLEDQERGLSPADRRKVSAQARGPSLLDTAQYPEITWRCDDLELAGGGEAGTLRGTGHGRLTMHGQERPVDVAFQASPEGDGWRVVGHGRLRQSDFGVGPFSGMGGALAVKDEVEVDISLVLGRGP
jgi:polyisoprenoid-binding protein YceI